MAESTRTSDRAVSVKSTNPSVAWVALLRLYVAKAGIQIPLIVIVQVLLAVGMVIGFGFLIPDMGPEEATFLTTGVPTTLLLMVGLVFVPQEIVKRRADGTMTFLRGLPVPRWMLLAGDLLVWLIVALPGVAIAIGVGALYFDLDLAITWGALAGVSVLVALMSTAVGYAIAVTLPQSQVVLVSQVLVFVILLFSPVAFPADRLPGWLQTVHEFLPFQPAADLMRASLARGYELEGGQLLTLIAWTVIGILLSLTSLARRG